MTDSDQDCRDCGWKMEFLSSEIGGHGSDTEYICKKCNLTLTVKRRWSDYDDQF